MNVKRCHPGKESAETLEQRPRGEVSKQSIRFLDLPSELRNAVYSVAVESSHATLFYKADTKPRRERVYPAAQVSKDACGTKFLGLTQVCRQIRQEYLSVHRKQSEVWIQLEDIDKYLATFYPSKDPSITKDYCGNLVIRTETGSRRYETEISDATTDILPLIKLCYAAPKISCRFKDEIYAEEDDLNKLFYRNNPAWGKCLINGSVAEIRVNPFHGSIRIFFESEGAEPWMYTSTSERFWHGHLVDFQQMKPEMRKSRLLQVKNEDCARFLRQVGLGSSDLKLYVTDIGGCLRTGKGASSNRV